MRKTKIALAASLAGVITIWALSSSAVFAASPLPTPVKSHHFENGPGYLTLNGNPVIVQDEEKSSKVFYLDSELMFETTNVKPDAISNNGKVTAAEIIRNRLIFPRVLTKDTVLPTKLDGSDITWTSSDTSVIAENGKITAPATGMSDVITLTAKISFKNQTESKEFHVQVMGQDGKSILGYTRKPDKSTVYDIRIADSLHLGYSEDDKTFEPLNHNYGILFAKADYSVNTVQGETKLLKDPYVFRMKDSGFGIIATRTDLKGNPDAPGKVLFFTSEDLIHYTEVGMLTLDSAESEISGLSCEYDAAAGNYRIGWVGADGMEFYRTTSNFKTLSNMTEGPIFKTEGVQTGITGAIPGNVVPVTAEEGIKIKNKLGRVVNTTVDNPKLEVASGETVDFSSLKVTANYSDGSTSDKRVTWNQNQIDKIDFNTPGEYKVDGEIVQNVFPFPMMQERPDPNILYYKGKYYFISTDDAGQKRINIRAADTIAGLQDGKTEEHLLWDGGSSGNKKGQHWAPELHVISDKLYCFLAISTNGNWDGVQAHVVKLIGEDPLQASDWSEPRRVLKKDGTNLKDTDTEGITLDMTYFEQGKNSYVCWSDRTRKPIDEGPVLKIAKVSRDEPWKLISDPVKILTGEYGWDRLNNENLSLVEGPNVVKHNGTIYMVYSGGAVGPNYAVGMLTADENAGLTDPASWAKSGYAWMHSGSVEGEYGPGHNSFLIDEYGDVYNVYHAMFLNDNLRDASVRLVHFRTDGSPILDMTAEEEILPANKTVRATVTVNAVPSGWAADQGGVIDQATGIIIRPGKGEEDKVVKLTASHSLAGKQEQKTFTIAVAEKFTDAMVVEDVKNQLEIPNTNDIRGNITLPMELSASDGSGAAATITWATTNASIVDVNAEGSVPAGVVNRQAKDAHVTLTAMIKSGKASGTKTFDLLVKAKANLEETTAYLFGHFTGEGIDEEQIYFASSKDGNFWTDLNDRKPVLKSEIGMKGVRDPYIIRSHEGDKFYLLATDLSVRLQGWSNATSRGSRNLVIWESTDLVNWSEPWLSEVAVPGAGNAWAPEAIYDESTGEYVVFWASIVAGEAKNAKGEEQQRIFYSKTRDFRNFTPAQLYIARQKEDGSYTHIIDTTIIKAKGKYYRASADGQITIEESDSILGEWKRLFNLRELFNDNWKLDGNQIEGPEFFKYNKDDQKEETWGLLVDQYRSGEGYLPLLTTDISDATGEKWRILNKDAGDYSFDQLKKRHGTILPITKREYNAIMSKWGPKAPTSCCR